jgi:hypothetical protein
LVRAAAFIARLHSLVHLLVDYHKSFLLIYGIVFMHVTIISTSELLFPNLCHQSSTTRPPPRSAARQYSASRPHALLDRISSLSRCVRDATSHGMPTPFPPLKSALTNFSRQHRSESEWRPAEVAVPCVRGQAVRFYPSDLLSLLTLLYRGIFVWYSNQRRSPRLRTIL